MFAPWAARVRPTDCSALALTGLPSTTTAWVETVRAPRSAPIWTSACIPMVAIADSTSSCNASTSVGQTRRTPRVSRPRITTCSTSRRSTSCRVSAAKSTEVTPGWSGPVTVTSTVLSDATTSPIACLSRYTRTHARTGSLVHCCRSNRRSRSRVRPHRKAEAPPGGRVGLRWIVDLRSGARMVAGGSVGTLEDVDVVLVTARADMRFGAHLLDHVRVVQLEGRTLRADPRQLGEVVPRRRAAGGPFERVAVAPRVVDRDDLAVAVALEDVPQERQRRGTEHERTDGGNRVQGGEPVGRQVVGVATRHAL